MKKELKKENLKKANGCGELEDLEAQARAVGFITSYRDCHLNGDKEGLKKLEEQYKNDYDLQKAIVRLIGMPISF